MEHSGPRFSCRCRKCMEETSEALFALRDALQSLSLSLKDLQFESDLERRAQAVQVANTLLNDVRQFKGVGGPLRGM